MRRDRVDVVLRHGRLRGIVEENLYDGHYIAFRGIPYARPPIGELRFKDPIPPEPWSDVRDASKFGNEPMQMNSMSHEIEGSEDCLYLNVYTTAIQPTVKRAVMMWLYGGSFTYGSGNDSVYSPDHIIRHDVVLVTINYRLGVFGFMNLDHEIATGNQGLKDALMALRWIHENISNFGGDPENVTIFGESAGGVIVHFLATCPLADGLYHKAISQSGLALYPWAITEHQVARSFLLAKKLGNRSSDPKIAGEFLKTIDAKELIKASLTLLTKIEKQQSIMPFIPSLDFKSPNPFFVVHPTITLQRGIKVPYLFGVNSSEGIYFSRNLSEKTLQLIDSDLRRMIHPKLLSWLKQQSISIEELRFLYFGNKPVSMETVMNYCELMGDMLFYRGLYEVADIQIRLGHHSTYMYKFSYEKENSYYKLAMNINQPGVSHAEELSYLFYPYMAQKLGLEPPERNSVEYKIIRCMTQMWTNFAKTGNPTPAITELTPITWAPLREKDVYNYLNIDEPLRMETVHKEELRCNWKNVKHKL